MRLLKQFLALSIQSDSALVDCQHQVSACQAQLLDAATSFKQTKTQLCAKYDTLAAQVAEEDALIMLSEHAAPPCRIMVVNILLSTVAFMTLFVHCARPVRISNRVVPSLLIPYPDSTLKGLGKGITTSKSQDPHRAPVG